MGVMLDARLMGRCRGDVLDLGAMEAADVTFGPDGGGWAQWSRIGGAFSVLRFSWHTTTDGQLTLAVCEQLSGIDEQGAREVERRTDRDQPIRMAYRIASDHDALGRPATVLELGKEISPGTIGDRFALDNRPARHEHEPTDRDL